MMNKLLKQQRLIAAFLLTVLYLQLVLPLAARAGDYPIFQYAARYNAVNHTGGTPVYNSNAYTNNINPATRAFHPQAEDIGGPGQPEMQSFSSVNSSDMVDLFTGDFSYNLPLMDVGGYPVNIHYSSGISMDQEASWVGLGWNINPGTVSRTARGLPDDFNGTDSITRIQHIKDNKTVGANLGASVELAGFPLSIGGYIGVFHNTYNGWGTENGLNVGINVGQNAKGPLSGSLGVSNNSQTGLDVNGSLSVRLGAEDAKTNGVVTVGSNYNTRMGLSGLQLHTEVRTNISRYNECGEKIKNGDYGTGMGVGSFISFATPSYLPTITMPLTSSNFIFKAQIGGELWATHANAYLEGYVSRQYIRPEDTIQKLPAYGYLNFTKATNAKVLLDFNREKDIAFNVKVSPHIAIPQYDYDTYSITGEGTGGMFRPYRGDVGYIFDHAVKTKSEKINVSAELGFGGGVHVGTDVTPVSATTITGAWRNQNDLLKNIGFQQSDSTFQEVYFRNPGEKTINTSSFYNLLGADSLVRIKLSGSGADVHAASSFTRFNQAKPAGETTISSPVVKQQRDKRTQVISYLNAKDAALYGLDKILKSYDTSRNPVIACDSAYTLLPRVDGIVRKPHHLSEIKVLNGDGRIYVYGLPVYNVEQRDVTFAVHKETDTTLLNKGLVQYNTGDNSTADTMGKDSYFNKDITPAYAHSFLLTGLVSPDYVDIKGDGITDDDLGDAVKFNYSQLYGAANGYYNWRTPFDSNKANYSEGLKTYSRDDRGTYLFGKKEVWYMHSIESKTMIALFKTSDRTDALSVTDENGGYDHSKKLKRLDSIELFTKADLVKNGDHARPVKTVHFEYSYELCAHATGDGTDGKLTLKKIWFTYNGNNKGKLNPYQFYYHPDADNNNLPLATGNPSYNAKMYDRWGNYKDPASNPGGLNNIDYPYAVQDSIKSATYASAWHLTDIKLPSGGKMHVTFEGDDYGYVQDKRATQFFPIAGFGTNSTSTPQKYLYPSAASDCYYVFADVPTAVSSKTDIYNKYLEGIEKIYFKVAVKMPSDQWGSGYEFVPTYGEIDTFGTVTGNNKRFWIKLKAVDNESPVTKAAIQFLRLNLPSKAYPTSELGDNFDLGAAVKMLGSSFSEIKNTVDHFDPAAKSRNWCRETQEGLSFIRLDNPDYKKYGGGIRVKKIEIYDNWKSMTTRTGSAGLKESVYGQEYTYTTTKEINGNKITISSGVASYEPMIGGEENPFHTPIEYIEKVAPLAPANYMYTETPMCESFFPSAMVGYSKVKVRTINAKAKSANGWDETEFYTTKDYPTRVEFTPLDGDSKKRYNPKLKNLLKINAKDYVTVSQGFKIELNDMNGKMKSKSSYKENDSVNAIHYVANFYKADNPAAFQQHLNNTVWIADSASGHIDTMGQIGHEVEVMTDVRQQQSVTNTSNVDVNVDVIFPFAPPFVPVLVLPSAWGFPQHEESRFRSIAITKVVQRYGILDSVVVRDKGSIVSTKNLVYDGETGNPLVTRTNNEFNDPVYNFNYPAHWAYSGMGMAYKNINAVYRDKKIVDGRMMQMDGSSFTAEKYFESGDEIIATGTRRTSQTSRDGDCPLDNFDGPANEPVRLWAIDAAKGKEKNKGIYFIDSLGRPYSGKNVSLQIIRSGKRNFTDAFAGGITSLSNPVQEVAPGIFKIIIDSNTRVIHTTAATFKDLWKVENSLYQTDSCVTITTAGKAYGLTPQHTMTLLSTNPFTPNQSAPENLMLKDKIVAAYTASQLHNDIQNHITRALLKFDLSSIPSWATITTAKINLYGARPGDIWGFSPWTSDPDYSYEGERETFEGHLFAYPDPWDGVTKPPFFQWSHDYTTAGLVKAVLPTQSLPLANVYKDFTNINCADLIQDLIRKPANMQNMIFKISNEWYTGGGSHENRFASFFGLSYHPKSDCVHCSPVSLDVDYTYTTDTCYKVCRYNINDTAVNPYRWGILGNWRPDRAYTYYYARKESDASVTETDIRKEGVLKDFIPFWQFGSDSIRATTDSSRWVWNSASGQYNRKGYETENYDPLGRYNSGLYGYNQTLPVAVAQNSKYREILFDGFEDYGYKADNCNASCQTPREIDFVTGNAYASLQDTISHTGRYSLSVTANHQAVFTAAVTRDTLLTPAVSIAIDSTPVYDTIVTGMGTGLSATYKCVGVPGTPVTRTEGPIHFIYNNITLPVCTDTDPRRERMRGYMVTWTGKIQPRFTDDYIFYSNATESQPSIKIGSQVILNQLMGNSGTRTSVSIHLQAGKLYDITIEYPRFSKTGGNIDISWSSSRYLVKQTVPQANLYPTGISTGDTVGSVHTNIIKYCIAEHAVKPENIIHTVFSPVQGRKIAASLWVNTNAADCSNPTNNPVPEGMVTISFEGSAVVDTLQKTGVAIDGWQRYESFMDIPVGATKLYVTLKSNSANTTYFDDVRIHPYNSNMKSFVYDPISLRLMAELDENNYASFYEYDDDGTLIRVKKETERGVKTIKESRSALFKDE